VETDGISQLARILQLSITPVALISGVGLLLLSMTNRLGRVIDRSRELGREAEAAGGSRTDAEGQAGTEELRILIRRARLLLVAIGLVSTSIFLAVLMVGGLFAMHVWGSHLQAAILILFGVCLLCLVGSMSFFLGDILISIRWLRLSIGRYV
jgi:hypothetical protein